MVGAIYIDERARRRNGAELEFCRTTAPASVKIDGDPYFLASPIARFRGAAEAREIRWGRWPRY
jgi:hypothetical protein